MVKFRSMRTDAEEVKKRLMEQNEGNGVLFKMKDDPRITPIGKFIRKYSIDELPSAVERVHWRYVAGGSASSAG